VRRSIGPSACIAECATEGAFGHDACGSREGVQHTKIARIAANKCPIINPLRRARIVPASPNCSRRRATASGSPRTRRNHPRHRRAIPQHVAVAKICPRVSAPTREGRARPRPTPLEERHYRLAQLRNIALPLCAHHDAAGVLARSAASSPAAVDLVEDDESGTSFAPISASTSSVTRSAARTRHRRVDHVRSSEASSASSAVDLNDRPARAES